MKTLKKRNFMIGAALAILLFAVLSPATKAQTTVQVPVTNATSSFGTAAQFATFGSTALNVIKEGLITTVTGAVTVVTNILGWIAGVLIYLGAQLISFTFSLNSYIMEMPVVLTGWQVTRDLANLGFVLALIVIAFMTILRFNQYGAQKMLPKLIAAAILVNFSLMIGGAILDFTNVVTKFFIDRSLGNGSYAQSQDIGSEITAAFNPQKLLEIDQTTAKTLTPGFSTAIVSVGSLLFATAFTFLMALVMLAVGLMLLSRFVWLAFLMAIAPLPWLFNVIPIGQLKSEGGKWWSQFIHWAFVAPILSFFLYLTLATVNAVSNISGTILSQNSNASLNPTLISGAVLQLTNMLILVGFLIGGLMAANSMGIAGANALMGVAKKTGEKAKGWAGKQTVGRAGRLGRRALTAGSAGDKDGKSWLERGGESLGRIPVVGGAFRGLAGASFGAKEESKKEIDKSQGENKKYSKELLAAKLDKQTVMTEDDVGAALALAEKGGWNLLNDGTKAKLVKAIKRAGATERIAAFDPVAAAAAGMDLEKAVGKVEDVSKLDSGTLRQVAPYLRQQQIRDLGNKGSKAQKEDYISGIRETFTSGPFIKEKTNEEYQKRIKPINSMFELLQSYTDELDTTLKNYKDAKDLGDTTTMGKLQEQRKRLEGEIKNINSTLLNGGSYEVKEVSNLVGPNNQPQVTVKETITIEKPEGDTQKRRRALDSNSAAAKQTSWQGEGLYKERVQEHETS